MAELVSDLWGRSRKPELGAPPVAAVAPPPPYSQVALALAERFVRESENGLRLDPQLDAGRLLDELAITDDDLVDAIHELRSVDAVHEIKHSSGWIVTPTENTFAEFDHLWMPWGPPEDARSLLTLLMTLPGRVGTTADLARTLSWEVRRINPAITWLDKRGYVSAELYLETFPWVAHRVRLTDDGRRFAKQQR